MNPSIHPSILYYTTRTSRSSSPSSSKMSSTQIRRNLSSSTLTIEDLYKRFHNRPSPLNSTQFKNQHTDSPRYQLSLAATDSLSKFLSLALPAFTRFLTDIQGGQYNSLQLGAASRKWTTRQYYHY